MKASQKTIALWLVFLLLCISLFKVFDTNNKHRREIKFSEFIQYVKDGKVSDVTFKSENLIVGAFKDASTDGKKYFETIGDTENAKVFDILEKNNLIPNYEKAEKTPLWQQFLISWGPTLFIFLFFFMFRGNI